jgi:hypothetical protein
MRHGAAGVSSSRALRGVEILFRPCEAMGFLVACFWIPHPAATNKTEPDSGHVLLGAQVVAVTQALSCACEPRWRLIRTLSGKPFLDES